MTLPLFIHCLCALIQTWESDRIFKSMLHVWEMAWYLFIVLDSAHFSCRMAPVQQIFLNLNFNKNTLPSSGNLDGNTGTLKFHWVKKFQVVLAYETGNRIVSDVGDVIVKCVLFKEGSYFPKKFLGFLSLKGIETFS